jgi:hypothetical protein
MIEKPSANREFIMVGANWFRYQRLARSDRTPEFIRRRALWLGVVLNPATLSTITRARSDTFC